MYPFLRRHQGILSAVLKSESPQKATGILGGKGAHCSTQIINDTLLLNAETKLFSPEV